mgnify:CR=1 FL=1
MTQPGIYFDKSNKTFRLYCGDSLYAFAIGPDMSLEHLYWGKSLQMGYDLRYLCESVRTEIFATSEIASEFNATIHAQGSDISVPSSLIMNPELPPDLVLPGPLTLQRAYSDPVFPTISMSIENVNSDSKDVDKPSVLSGVQPLPPIEPHLSIPLAHKELALFANEYETHSGLQRYRLQNLIWRVTHILNMQVGTVTLNQLEIIEDILHGCITTPNERESSQSSHIETTANYFYNAANQSCNMITRKRNHIKDILDNHHRYLPGNLLQKLINKSSKDKEVLGEIGKSAYRTYARPSGSGIGKGMLLLEFSDNGTGDFRPPSFQCICPNGSSITPLKYCSHSITRGKIELPNYMPSIRCDSNANECTTLSIVMSDRITGVVVELIYNCMHNYDVITRRAVFRNAADCTTCHPAFR